MILCVNPNAAIDKTVVVTGFHLNQIHRPQQVLAIAGGKGCNVARGLQIFGEAPVVTGWVGGFAGQFIEAGLQREGIQTAFVHSEAESRTCLSIVDPAANTITELYEKGDPISAGHVEAFIAQFRATIGHYAAVTLSGSLPPGVPADFYAQLIAIARDANVLTFLDSSGQALTHGLEAQPFLVKPNRKEFADLIGQDLPTLTDLIDAVKTVAVRYSTWIVLSLGVDGALASDGKSVFNVCPPPVTVKSAVGSGDCMLAGIVYGLTHGFTFEKAVVHGVAAGTANTLTIGAGKFTSEDFEYISPRVTIQIMPFKL